MTWHIELLGWLRATNGDQVISRFRTHRAAALLGYLALHPQRSHAREALIEHLWPEIDAQIGRHNLRVALSSLRHQLEPPGVPRGAVLVADAATLRMNPAACTTDVAQFAAARAVAARAGSAEETVRRLIEAAELYRGELLPGCFDEWALWERQRLADAWRQVLRQLVRLLEAANDPHRAVDYALRAVAADPWDEESHADLTRLLAAAGQPAAAVRRYQELQRLLEGCGRAPAAALRATAHQLAAGRGPAGGKAGRSFSEQRSSLVSPAPTLRPEPLPAGMVTFLVAELVSSEHSPTAGAQPAGAPVRAEAQPSGRDGTAGHGGAPSGTGGTLPAPSSAPEERLALLARGLEAHGGCGVRRAGQTLTAAFGRPTDALLAAAAAHRALAGSEATEPASPQTAPSSLPAVAGAMTARIVLYTSEVSPFWGEDRPPLPAHAAALLRLAHPGQILVSEATAVLLRPGLPAELQLADLGRYRLDPAAVPETLFQVSGPGQTPRDFPPLDALPAAYGSWPVPLSRCFGREAAITRLRGLLTQGLRAAASEEDPGAAGIEPAGSDLGPAASGGGRLITLTGMGGSGKTRLALEAAAALRADFHDRVWFVPLQDLPDPSLLPGAILAALRLPRAPETDLQEQLVAALAHQPALLLLDSFAHLAGRGAPAVRQLLERLPLLTLLITSRQSLLLPGEQQFPVAPLPVPGEGIGGRAKGEGGGAAEFGSDTLPSSPFALMQFPSVQLFVDRAQAVQPDFQLTERNAGVIAALCNRLEGLPLALELAAARVRMLTPAQMLARLRVPEPAAPPDEPAGRPEAAGRFVLLVGRRFDPDPRHRSLRAALDWSYQLLPPDLQRCFARLSIFRGGFTLEAAAAVQGGLGLGNLDDLEQLRDASLILTEVTESAPEVRYRLLDTLREYGAEQLDPEEQACVARRHAAYYLGLAETAEPQVQSEHGAEWLARLETESGNLRAALGWLERDEEAVTPAAAWKAPRPAAPEGLAWVLPAPSEPLPSARAALRLAAALCNFWYTRGHWQEGRGWLERLLRRRGAETSTPARTKALGAAAMLAYTQGDYSAARALAEEGLSIGRCLEERRGTAFLLYLLGLIGVAHDDLPAGRAAAEECLAVWRELGDRWGIALALNGLASARRASGDAVGARLLLEECLALWRAVGNGLGTAAVLNHLGDLALQQEDPALARTCLEECLEQYQRTGYRTGMSWALISLGRTAWREGNMTEAARLARESITLRRELSDHRDAADCLELLARVAAARQQPERAVRLLGAAQGLRGAAGFPPPAPPDPEEAARLTVLRAALGGALFQAAWNAGQAMTWEQAAALALHEPPSADPPAR